MPYRNPVEQGGYEDGYDGKENWSITRRAQMTGNQAASYAKGYSEGKAARVKDDAKKAKKKSRWI